MKLERACALIVGLALPVPGGTRAAPQATFSLREPLGHTWTNEIVHQDVTLDLGEGEAPAGSLRVLGPDGEPLPAQFYGGDGAATLLRPEQQLSGTVPLRALFRTTLPKDAEQTYAVTAYPTQPAPPETPRLAIRRAGGGLLVSNGVYEVRLARNGGGLVDGMRLAGERRWLGTFRWPEGATPASVADEVLEAGPLRSIIKRTFRFHDRARRCELELTFFAGEPWIGVRDTYALGRGTRIELDLRDMNADVARHESAYNARTFKPGSPTEDTTIEPPQHPIATIGPIWRDIWYGGGPAAIVYRKGGSTAIGIAATQGSEWSSPDGVSLESQNFELHGDRETPGQVVFHIPTDEGSRRWAFFLGSPERANGIGGLIRKHADIPLDKVLHEWILEWEPDPTRARPAPNVLLTHERLLRLRQAYARPGSPARRWADALSAEKPHAYTRLLAGERSSGGRPGPGPGVYLDGPYNKHFHNPTTYPRRVHGALMEYDLAMAGEVIRSPGVAALAYIFTDPNYWPGPDYRWKIGNPNFHSDMYSIVLIIAAMMPDHPHAPRWMEFGLANLRRDLEQNSWPGGAWRESLSYAKYGFGINARASLIARNSGFADPFHDWPRTKEVINYLLLMHGPPDPRFGYRQIAPIGDTSPGAAGEIAAIAAYAYKDIDPAFAAVCRGFALSVSPDGTTGKPSTDLAILDADPIAPADLSTYDWSSRTFPGFGAMMRGNAFTDVESFVTIKSGPARNHFQADEQSFTFHGLGVPLAIDYACHYSPRPWSAAMHNRPDMNGKRPITVATPRRFVTHDVADVFVSDEETDRVALLPLEPHNTTKPGWEYPEEELGSAWRHRRWVMLVKHDPDASAMRDYLVVRDEVRAPEPVCWNLHVLARSVQQDGRAFHFAGQLGADLHVLLAAPEGATVQQRQWGWGGKTSERRSLKGAEYEAQCFGRILPPDFEPGSWTSEIGERAVWLRVKAPAGEPWLAVLYPVKAGADAPRFEQPSGTSVRLSLGDQSETIHLGTEGIKQAAVERAGELITLIERGAVAST